MLRVPQGVECPGAVLVGLKRGMPHSSRFNGIKGRVPSCTVVTTRVSRLFVDLRHELSQSAQLRSEMLTLVLGEA